MDKLLTDCNGDSKIVLQLCGQLILIKVLRKFNKRRNITSISGGGKHG
jgi:hypothetical protein